MELGLNGRVVLVTVLEHICRLLHPIMPFVTEAIWHILRARLTGVEAGSPAPVAPERGESLGFRDCFGAMSLAIGDWPVPHPRAVDQDADATIALLQEAIGAIRNIRGEMHIPPELKVEVLIEHRDATARGRLGKGIPAIQQLASAGACEIGETVEHPEFASTFVSGDLTILVKLPQELVDQERQRLEKELTFSEKGLVACRNKLENEKFVSKAPLDVVRKERERLAKLEADVDAMRSKLEALRA